MLVLARIRLLTLRDSSSGCSHDPRSTDGTHACPWMNTVVSASPWSYSSTMYRRYTDASLPLPLARCGQQDSSLMASASFAAVASAQAAHTAGIRHTLMAH
jgi:hypothetical protein